MAIVTCNNRKQGITYVYDSQGYFDEEQQKYRYKRTLLGKIDPETGEMIPTGKRGGYHPPKEKPSAGQPDLEPMRPGRKKKQKDDPVLTDEGILTEVERLKGEVQSLEEKVAVFQSRLASEQKSRLAAEEKYRNLVDSLRTLIQANG